MGSAGYDLTKGGVCSSTTGTACTADSGCPSSETCNKQGWYLSDTGKDCTETCADKVAGGAGGGGDCTDNYSELVMSCAATNEDHARAVVAAVGAGSVSAASPYPLDFVPAYISGQLFYSSGTWSNTNPPSRCQATGMCADGRTCLTMGSCTGDGSMACTPGAKTCLMAGKGSCDTTALETSLECGKCSSTTSTLCTENADCPSSETCVGTECFYGTCSGSSSQNCNNSDDCACTSFSLGKYPNIKRFCYCMEQGHSAEIVG